LVTMGHPTPPPKKKITPCIGNCQSQLPVSSSDPAYPPPQVASTSNQLFCHNAPDRPTDRPPYIPTDGPGNNTCTSTHLRCIDYIASWLIITEMIFMVLLSWLCVVPWLYGNTLVSVNEVTLHQAELIPEWVTIFTSIFWPVTQANSAWPSLCG